MRQSRSTAIATATPVAETNGAAGAAGTNGSASDSGHVHPMFTAMALVGSNVTEQTMTGVAAADLVTIGGLNIPAAAAMLIRVSFRKTATNAQQVGIGLKLNATTVVEAQAGPPSGIAVSSAALAAEDGVAYIWIGPRSANYPCEIISWYGTRTSATGAVAQAFAFASSALAALPPQVAITSVIIRGINVTANNNLSVAAVEVFAAA